MKLILNGSENQYALDQLAISMFPNDKHSFTASDSLDYANCTVHHSKTAIHAEMLMCIGRKIASSESEYIIKKADDAQMLDAEEKQLIKRSFYLAAIQITGEIPAWGCLSGVRPAKLSRMKLQRGESVSEVSKSLIEEYFVCRDKAILAANLGKIAKDVQEKLEKRDVSIYISIPFCPTRCAYCSFVSSAVGANFELIRPYIDALKLEIEKTAQLLHFNDIKIDTIYIGGGTPTTLSANELREVITHLASCFDISCAREFSVEAGRPDTITKEKLLTLKECGVTRISVNPQTMNDDVLHKIGRKHSADDTEKALMLAKSVGFTSINMDLIAGLQGESYESFQNSIDRVITLEPTDITVHTLALKKGADYKSEDVQNPNELGKMLLYAQKALMKSDYRPYYLYRQKYMGGSFENIGWSNGDICLYNILMMEEIQTVISFGAGGITKLHNYHTDRIERLSNHKYPLEYINDIEHIICTKSKIKEYFDVMEVSK